MVEGELVAAIGENRKLVIFPLDQVPEMARGRGVRLQRYKDGGLSDIKTFKAADGLSWVDAAGREFSLTMKELADWRGNRADAGRLAPKGFPRNNKFGPLPVTGRTGGDVIRNLGGGLELRSRVSSKSPQTGSRPAIFPARPRRCRRSTALAGAAVHAHDDQIVLGLASFGDDRLVRGDVGAHRGLDRES